MAKEISVLTFALGGVPDMDKQTKMNVMVSSIEGQEALNQAMDEGFEITHFCTTPLKDVVLATFVLQREGKDE